MLIPRFNLRWLLAAMSASGGFFFVVGMAMRGNAWAVGVSWAIASIFIAFVVYVAVFFGAWTAALLLRALRPSPAQHAPFASDAPPPQILPPENPD